MPDTFSTNLKVLLPEQGSRVGTWAPDLNTLGLNLLDDSIGGLSDINVASATTYSLAALSNGTDSESRAMRLRFTGTPASTLTVTVPTSVTSKLYIVSNALTGTVPLIIKYAATAGTTIDNGVTQALWFDGTNLVPIQAGYNRTAAEIAAGVTPTNLAIPSHDATGYVYPERYGAVGDDATANQVPFDNAIAVAAPNGIPIRLSDGIYRVAGQLLRSSSGIQHGLRIIGNGSRKTIIKSAVASASALRLVKTDINNFDWGGELSGLTLRGNGGGSARGLELVGQWHMKIHDVVIEDFTSDGIWIPNRTDLDPTPDPWSTQYLDARALTVQNNGGWALLDPAQLALSGTFRNCGFNSNTGGGISTGTSTLLFKNCSISYNGSGGSNGGLLVVNNGFTPFSLQFDTCEFDSNYNYNERIESGARIIFTNCRDLSTEDSGPVQRPATQTRITGGSSCIGIKFIRPARRSTGTAALTWYDLGNSANVGDVDIVDLEDLGSTSALTRIANQGTSTVCHFQDYSGLVRRARLRGYHITVTRSSNQSINTGTITKVEYDTIDATLGRYGQTAANADFDVATNFRWTAPFDGRVSLRGYLTMASAWAGMGTIHAYINNAQAAFIRVSCQAADAQTNFPICFNLDMSAGDFVDIRVDQSSGGALNVLGGTAQGHLTIEYAASS